MAGTGPAPNPNRRRRNATVPMVPLPADGRDGPLPEWPLGADIVTRAKLRVAADKVEDLEYQSGEGLPVEHKLTRARERLAELQAVVDIQYDRELELWRQLWTTPQAVQWERLRWEREVAQYTRWKVLGESGDLNAAKEARQLSDRIGLTPLALLRLRWEIVDRMPGPRVAPEPAPAADGTPGSGATVHDMTTRKPSRRSRLS